MKLYKNKWIITTGLVSMGIMVMIFLFSNQIRTDSDAFSGRFSYVVMKIYIFISKLLPVQSSPTGGEIYGEYSLFDDINHYVRKAGHMTEYALLASALLCHLGSVRAAKNIDKCDKKISFGKTTRILALIITVIYAISDEIHQLFVDGRGAEVKDVCIDALGGSLGIIGLSIIFILINKRNKDNLNGVKQT